MPKYDYIIGIDPDAKASGVAWIEVDLRQIQLMTLTFPELLEKIHMRGHLCKTLIVVEASWIRQTKFGNTYNWHTEGKDNKSVVSAKGQGIARNQETGRKIVEVCKYHNMDVQEVFPLKKCWKGPDKKITQDELAGILLASGVKVDRKHLNITNQEERDAAWLALNFSGIPIKIPVSTSKPQQNGFNPKGKQSLPVSKKTAR